MGDKSITWFALYPMNLQVHAIRQRTQLVVVAAKTRMNAVNLDVYPLILIQWGLTPSLVLLAPKSA